MRIQVFDESTLQVIEKCVQASAEEFRKAQVYMLPLIGNAIVMLGVFGFEYEVFYRIFQYLAGDDHDFWTPWIMGCSSMILVVAIHALASSHTAHPIHRFMSRITGVLIPIYLMGIGLLLVAMIYNDGLRDMLANNASLSFDGDPFAEQTTWLNTLMETVATPIATLLFCAGIGAIAIINVFVAHHAMKNVQSSVSRISEARTAYKADQADLEAYEAARADFDIQQGHIDNLIIRDDDSLRQALANEVLLILQEEIAPAQQALTQLAHSDVESSLPFLTQKQKLNPKELEKSIKAITAIDLTKLINHMK